MYTLISIGVIVLFIVVVGGGCYGEYKIEKNKTKIQKEEYNLCKLLGVAKN